MNKNLIRKIKNETFQNEKWYTISRQQTKSLNKNETDNPTRKMKYKKILWSKNYTIKLNLYITKCLPLIFPYITTTFILSNSNLPYFQFTRPFTCRNGLKIFFLYPLKGVWKKRFLVLHYPISWKLSIEWRWISNEMEK